MTTNYHHGVRVIEVTGGARPTRTVATAVIGIVATADDADPLAFPANKPVLLTNARSAIGKAGTQGTLRKALQGIVDQCDPVVVVIRVASGADEAETTSNVIGGVSAEGQFTGIQALLAAQAQLGVKPRIIAAPGLDTQAVATALAVAAKSLRGMAYVGAGSSATKTEAAAYRESFGEREVMVIWPDWTAWDATANALVTVPATAYAVGLRALIDQIYGWHKTISNVPVSGVMGVSRDVHFDLQNPTSDTNFLNSHDVTTLINDSGFKFWGSRTCSADPAFAFESAVRTGQILADTIAEAISWAVDKPMHPTLVRDILEQINAHFRRLKAQGYIIDGKAWYDETVNTSDSLAGGKLTIDYDYTPVPPLEDVTLQQRITDRYFADFAARVTD